MPSRRRRACRASTSTAARSARARPTPIEKYVASKGGSVARSAGRDRAAHRARRRHAARRRRTDARALGVIHLKDIVKGGIAERFAHLRAMGIKTVMITGDNPLTAAAIAAEAGVDDFLAQATPEDKMALIKREQADGKLVAMTGDGTNDAPALAQADVGVAMNTGTQAAQGSRQHGRSRLEPDQADRDRRDRQAAADHPRRADDVLDRQRRREVLRDHPGDVRWRRSRCSTRSNIMGLQTPQSAILSAVIFNALIIVALVPLALRGIRYRPDGRRGAAPAQPADLRRRRHHRAVHRHQDHRRHHHGAAARVASGVRTGDIMNITRNLIAAVLMTIVTTVLLGVVYPLVITGIAQVAFPDKANGQLIERDGKVVGSRIIGQGFSSPGYFRSRPSAAGTGYDAANSAGSNLGPTNKKLDRRREGERRGGARRRTRTRRCRSIW